MQGMESWRMWDWTCSKCGKTGSAPVDIGMSGLSALTVALDHHAEISADCAAHYQGRWVEITCVTAYRQLPATLREYNAGRVWKPR